MVGILRYDCEKAMRLTIPAVRAAISTTLSEKYKMNETDIAKILGIAQAAVSKYISGKYSNDVNRLVKAVHANKFDEPAIKAILAKRNEDEIADVIDKIASSDKLVSLALKRK